MDAAIGAVIPFDFETHAIRVSVLEGVLWWGPADVAKVLGYRLATDAARLLRDRHEGIPGVNTPGGEQEMLVVGEAGLLRLMMRREGPNAEPFQDWITDEVLPAIRKTGTCTVVATDPAAA